MTEPERTYTETLETAAQLSSDDLEILYNEMVVMDHENLVGELMSPELIAVFRAHETICEKCRAVRIGLGERVFKGTCTDETGSGC